MTDSHADALVFFGATGDLAYKQIFPALQAMIRSGHLDMPIIGVAGRPWSIDQLQARAHDSLEQHGGVDKAAFDKLCSLLQTEILVELKTPPQAVFRESEPPQSNYFRFRLSPDVMISLGARAKVPGEAMRGEAVELVARHQSGDEMAPYERLLGDAIRGDPALFVREGAVEAAWKVVDAALGNVTPAYAYTPNT